MANKNKEKRFGLESLKATIKSLMNYFISDAPSDGLPYVRVNGKWVNINTISFKRIDIRADKGETPLSIVATGNQNKPCYLSFNPCVGSTEGIVMQSINYNGSKKRDLLTIYPDADRFEINAPTHFMTDVDVASEATVGGKLVMKSAIEFVCQNEEITSRVVIDGTAALTLMRQEQHLLNISTTNSQENPNMYVHLNGNTINLQSNNIVATANSNVTDLNPNGTGTINVGAVKLRNTEEGYVYGLTRAGLPEKIAPIDTTFLVLKPKASTLEADGSMRIPVPGMDGEDPDNEWEGQNPEEETNEVEEVEAVDEEEAVNETEGNAGGGGGIINFLRQRRFFFFNRKD